MAETLDFTFDPEADAAYLSAAPDIADGDAVTQQVVEVDGRGDLVLDWDRDGRLLGVEILGASSLLRRSSLALARPLP